jgi:hypothetical protein
MFAPGRFELDVVKSNADREGLGAAVGFAVFEIGVFLSKMRM